VVWSSSAHPGRAARHGIRQVPRRSPVRRWLRIGALLTIIGVLRLSRIARAHPRPSISLAGTAITVAGISLPSEPVLISGFLVLLLALFIPSDPAEGPAGPCAHRMCATPFMPRPQDLPPVN
jgi:hypothetical protein